MQKDVERFPVKGIFKMVVRKNGKIVEVYEDHNLIVNGARNQAARLFAGQTSNRPIARMTDTAITEQYAKAVEGFEFPEMGQIQTNWELGVNENNGMAIMEFGLLSEDGTLLCRKVRANPIHKEADISIEGHWTWIF